MVAAAHAGAVLTVDLDAIAANYALLCRTLGKAECAAVVKSDAYGLGLAPVSRRLARKGCRRFFVAQLGEAIELRAALADVADDATIYVLNGVAPGTEADYDTCRAVPMLNSLDDIAAWSAHAGRCGSTRPAGLHVDTGMARLGLSSGEVDILAAEPTRLSGVDLILLMSHLACAEERDNPLNREQRSRFDRARALLPPVPASFANSSGLFLGPEYHYDLGRPGASLYGLAPIANESNPMRQVINLQGRILQVRRVDRGMTVGYGAAHRVTRQGRIATVAVGYGDGYLRSLGNRGSGYIGEALVPLVGRVSMDLITFDVSDVPEAACRPGMTVELIGERHTADDLAREAGTIGYEILTGLGRRYVREYRGAV
jgi:alanine racemase